MQVTTKIRISKFQVKWGLWNTHQGTKTDLEFRTTWRAHLNGLVVPEVTLHRQSWEECLSKNLTGLQGSWRRIKLMSGIKSWTGHVAAVQMATGSSFKNLWLDFEWLPEPLCSWILVTHDPIRHSSPYWTHCYRSLQFILLEHFCICKSFCLPFTYICA